MSWISTIILSFAFGYLVLGPVVGGHWPFTTPAQAARGERRIRSNGGKA